MFEDRYELASCYDDNTWVPDVVSNEFYKWCIFPLNTGVHIIFFIMRATVAVKFLVISDESDSGPLQVPSPLCSDQCIF